MDPCAPVCTPDVLIPPPPVPHLLPPVPYPDEAIHGMPSITPLSGDTLTPPNEQGAPPTPLPSTPLPGDEAPIDEWMKYSRRPRHLDVLDAKFSCVIDGLAAGRRDKSEWVKTRHMTTEEIAAHKKRLSRNASAMTLKRKVAESNFLLDVATNSYLETRAIDDMVSRVFCQNMKMAADLEEERSKRRKLEAGFERKMDEMNKKLETLVEIANATKMRREARASSSKRLRNDGDGDELCLDLSIGLGVGLELGLPPRGDYDSC